MRLLRQERAMDTWILPIFLIQLTKINGKNENWNDGLALDGGGKKPADSEPIKGY